MLRALWGGARTTALLAAAGLASALLVDLPTTFMASAHGHGAPASVPASDKWITLGTGPEHKLGAAARSPVEQLSTPLLEREQAKPLRQPLGAQLASLGRESPDQDGGARSLSGGHVRWSASPGCLNATLRRVIAEVSSNFGPVTVNSTCPAGSTTPASAAPRIHTICRVMRSISATVAMRTRCWHSLVSTEPLAGLKHYAEGPRRTW
jgi:hypothetical protein